MKFLVLYTHQTWPMHYFHAGVLARALQNDGHEVLWLNCEKVMFGCHAQWIVPSVPAEDICAACVSRGSWLDTLELPHANLSRFLTPEDREAAERARSTEDIPSLLAWVDRGCPVGRLALSSPASVARILTLEDPTPGFVPMFQDAVASAILVNRALERLFETEGIDRVLFHLGRLVPDAIAQHHANVRKLPWFSYETAALRDTLFLGRDATPYEMKLYVDSWGRFAEAPLSVDQMAVVQDWLLLRRRGPEKSGMLSYGAAETPVRTLFEQLGVAPTPKMAVVFTSSVDEVSMIGWLVDQDWSPVYTDQYALLHEAVEWARAHPDWTLVIRVHPNEGARSNHLGMAGAKSMERFVEIFRHDTLPANTRVVLPDEKISSYTLMAAAALGIVWASTAGLEMATMGRPVIVADNAAYRCAGFAHLLPTAGRLAETIDAALATSRDERVARAICAQRFAYHQLARFLIPFPLVHDHGRMDRVSLEFGSPAELVRGRWAGLDLALDYLAYDRFPYPTAAEASPGDARNERAGISRLLAADIDFGALVPRSAPPESLNSAEEFTAAVAGHQIPVEEAQAIWEELQRVLRLGRGDAPMITVGPISGLIRALAPARSHLTVDHRSSDLVEAEIGGLPSTLPFRPRCASIVLLHGLGGDDPFRELLAARTWLRPGGILLVLDFPGMEPTDLVITPVGLRRRLQEIGLTSIVVRAAEGGGTVAVGVVPAAADAELRPGARRDVLSQVLPAVRRDEKRITTLDGKTVLLVRRGAAWSAWPEHLFPAQPVPDYYRFDRPEVRQLVPPTAKRILDVGCAGGGLGAAIKRARPGVVVDGIEVVPYAAHLADTQLDRVFVGPVEKVHVQLTDDTYDCIIFADVLEHTVEPTEVLRLLRPKLKPDGQLVVSLPNIRHWTVLRPLLEGKFDYEDAGILDRTHLRFFTRQTMVELFHHHGFDVTQIRKINFGGEAPAEVVDALKGQKLDVGTLLDESGAYQYLLVCQRRPEPRERLTSVILLAWNQLAYTKLCIESVFKHTHVPFELILVDNGSHDGTPEYFRELRRNNANVKLVLNPKNLGFGKGCNQGLAVANGDYVCFLNNDTVVFEGWLEHLQWWAELEPNVGIVGPVSNRVAGIQRIAPVSYDEDAMTPEGLAAMERYAHQHRAANRHESVFVNRIIGLCLLVKREVVERIGGFDTRYGTGNFEDDDLCFRARVAGYKVVIARDVFIHHYGSKSFEGNKVDYSATMERNMERFLKKWGFERADGGYKPTGLEAIVYDRARHFAPYGAEEGFRSDALPVRIEEAHARNILIVPPWGEDGAIVALLRTLGPLSGDFAFWVRCPPYEGKNYLASLEKLTRTAGLTVQADVRVIDAPLAPDREAGLYLAASAVYVDEAWPDADLVLRRAADCGLTALRTPVELTTFLK